MTKADAQNQCQLCSGREPWVCMLANLRVGTHCLDLIEAIARRAGVPFDRPAKAA